MSMTFSIPRRFRGPANSANGGYACGMVAAFAPGDREVTLRQPPPLDKTLRLEDGPVVQVFRKDRLILESRPTTVEVEPPKPIGFTEATERSQWYIGHRQHALPECFVCGPQRAHGDGLRIFPGRESPDQPVAAPWVPDASLTAGSGPVGLPILWAALDCPGYFAVGRLGESALLGRMAARVRGRVEVGERCVVMGWSLGREGRKLRAATALFGEDRRVVGVSVQTWLTVDPNVTG